ncbi:hypothetical protein ACFQ3K_11735 [Brucella gallinifaecis]|uniref:Uncharacterized protein n=1 Tax=Brucella gallinifaecis TaxID=215590 RepID=A0A502BK62_9HYPH|nr:hypothetical protein [Brucella gallinifaecis]TPF74872.1 hypothetical protein FHY56_12720 [Brucella gallinifaecis]
MNVLQSYNFSPAVFTHLLFNLNIGNALSFCVQARHFLKAAFMFTIGFRHYGGMNGDGDYYLRQDRQLLKLKSHILLLEQANILSVIDLYS